MLAGLSAQPATRQGAAPVSTAPAASARSSSAAGAAQPAIAIDLVQCRGCAVRLTDRSVQPAARFALQQTDLSVQGVSQRLDQVMKIDLRTRAQGRGQLGFQGDLRPEPLALKGQVSVSALDLRALQPYLDPHVNVTLAGAAALAQGRVNVDTVRNRGGDVLNVRYQGRLGLQDLRLRDRVNDAMLLRWASFTLDRADLAWRDGAVDADLGFIALKDFYGRVIVNRDGTLNLASVVRREGEAATTSVTTPQEAGNPFRHLLRPRRRIGIGVGVGTSADHHDHSRHTPSLALARHPPRKGRGRFHRHLHPAQLLRPPHAPGRRHLRCLVGAARARQGRGQRHARRQRARAHQRPVAPAGPQALHRHPGRGRRASSSRA